MSADESIEPRAAMPFLAHIGELRTRVFRATLATLAGFFIAWSWHVELYSWLSAPLRRALADNNLFSIKALQITESIEVYMKLSLYGGLFLASPVIFYQIWAFVAPGLVAKERRLIGPIVAGSVSCFVLGAAFCYLVVLPFMTDFLIKLTVDAPGMTLEPTLASTVSFSLLMLLAFGAVFELPLFMYVLAALGMVTARDFLGFYRYWIVIAFIIGAVLTPTPDPINQTMMSAPLIVLYGVGVIIAWFVQRAPGEKVPRRTIALVTLILIALAAGGVTLALRGAERGVLDDLPADARQVIGVHESSLARWHQQAAPSSAAARALAPFSLLELLHIRPLASPLVVLVRFDDGVAVIAEVPDSEAVVRKLATRFQSSLVPTPSGLSTWFHTELSAENLRAVAASRRVLWLGTDGALAHLAAVHSKRKPSLLEDPALAEKVAALRSAGPLWSLAPSAAGIAGWLPGGALTRNVRLATAVVLRDRAELVLNFDCLGTDSSIALRDRIDAWMGDSRRELKSDEQRSNQAVIRRLHDLALVVAHAADSTARLTTPGGREHQDLTGAAAEAMRMARELGAPRAAARPEGAAADALVALIQPPALAHAEANQGHVVWSVQAELPRLLDAMVAPASAGLDKAPEVTPVARMAPKPAP